MIVSIKDKSRCNRRPGNEPASSVDRARHALVDRSGVPVALGVKPSALT